MKEIEEIVRKEFKKRDLKELPSPMEGHFVGSRRESGYDLFVTPRYSYFSRGKMESFSIVDGRMLPSPTLWKISKSAAGVYFIEMRNLKRHISKENASVAIKEAMDKYTEEYITGQDPKRF